jgi:hypothetical protein
MERHGPGGDAQGKKIKQLKQGREANLMTVNVHESKGYIE